MLNLKIIQGLEGLKAKRKQEGQTYRVKAYEKAIESLRNHPTKITSGKQAQSLPGIGKSIADHIDKILANQEVTLSEVPVLSVETEEEKTIKLFCELHGVGPIKAKEWYELGYRTIDDLRKSDLKFTYTIRVSLDNYEALQERIPRSRIQHFERELKDWASDNLQGTQIEICGSYRRGLPDSGDIDVIICGNANDLFDRIQNFPLIHHILGRGSKKLLATFMLDGKLGRVDFENVKPKEYAYALLYFTGSKEHNEAMRARAKEKNYRLNEKSMYEISIGMEFIANSERDIFKLLGMEYKAPEQR